MSIASIVTHGFGPWGSIGDIVRHGFSPAPEIANETGCVSLISQANEIGTDETEGAVSMKIDSATIELSDHQCEDC